MIGKRLVTSLGLGIITLLAVVFEPICGIVVTLFIAMGLYEFFNMVEKKEVKLFKSVGILTGILIPFSIYMKFPIKETGQFLFTVIGLFLLFLLELTKKENHQTIFSISATIFGILYISWCFSFLIRIRQLPQGEVLSAFLLIVTKFSDIGAYFWGKKFGKISLIKRVSPQKSLEGAVGGFFTSVSVGILLFWCVKDVFSFVEGIVLIIILAIVSQLGDLFESLIKRDCKVKDSGKLLPGMGGVLDVIDSIIFTAPTFYLYTIMMR
ncbi:MAG: hypothetical protein B6D56_01040 [Candidatus Omnitrophica bacterium 4484_70.1]|nr:MAG: hypothetical protein B6D56_01040 [Candidatus Omnitrophica bacterium 4484_70.1]